MIASRVLIPCVITGLVASGCLELVRRHPDPVPELDNGNPAQAQNVQGTGRAEENAAAGPDPALNAPDSSAVEVTPPSGSTAAADTQPGSTADPAAEIVAAELDGEPQENAKGIRPDSTATQQVTQRAPVGQASNTADETELVEEPDKLEQSASESVATKSVAPTRVATKSARILRTKGQQGSVKQINEYAFWCVENRLWKEARTHLEHAIEQDSSSASLYNNIGIVYEHFGEEEEALDAYRRAYALNPKQRRYRGNIDLLERRWRAVPDSLGRIEIFDMDQVNSPDSAAVVTPADPEPTTDEGSGEGHPSMGNGSRRAER